MSFISPNPQLVPSFAQVPVGFIFPQNTNHKYSLGHKSNKLKRGRDHKISLQHEFNKVLQRLTQSGLLARAIKRQSGVVDLVQVFEIQEL